MRFHCYFSRYIEYLQQLLRNRTAHIQVVLIQWCFFGCSKISRKLCEVSSAHRKQSPMLLSDNYCMKATLGHVNTRPFLTKSLFLGSLVEINIFNSSLYCICKLSFNRDVYLIHAGCPNVYQSPLNLG